MAAPSAQEQAFVEHIAEVQGILHKVCGLYARDPEDRADLMQEIMAQLWRAYPRFRGDAKFSTWVYRIALNVAISGLRKQKRRPVERLLDELPVDVPDPGVDHARQERLQQLYQAVERLSKVEKALVMLYLDDLDFTQMGTVLGITPNNARVKMSRVRGKLRKWMTTED